jgi:hypothetical protein
VVKSLKLILNFGDIKNYNQLKELLIKISKIEKEFHYKEQLYDFFNQKDIMKYLNSLLDPKKNGFKMGIENLEKDKEV